MSEDSASFESAIHRVIRGDNPRRSVTKIAELAQGGSPVITADDWLVALPELDGVAVKFAMMDALRDAYLWHDGDAYRASNLGLGLEDREDTPLSRLEAGALLDGGVMPMSEPVPVEEAVEYV